MSERYVITIDVENMPKPIMLGSDMARRVCKSICTFPVAFDRKPVIPFINIHREEKPDE